MFGSRHAARIAALIALILPSIPTALRADDTAVLLRVVPSITLPGEYSVTVEAAAGSPGCTIAGVSFALAVPAGATAVAAGPDIWSDAPVPPVQSVPGGLRVGAILDGGHDLSAGPCEIVRFQTSSPAGIAFIGASDGLPVAAVVSSVDGRSLSPYTRVLSGTVVAPVASAPGEASAASESSVSSAAASAEGGEGGVSMLGSEPLPCDAVEIAKLPPESFDHWFTVPKDYPEIQDAIDDVQDPFSGIGGVVVVEIDDGTYGPIAIDLLDLANNQVASLTLFSRNGPSTTIIEGTSTQRPVLIAGNPATNPLEVHLGLVLADDPDVTVQTDWHGFTIRSASGGGPALDGGGVAIQDAFPFGEPGQVLELRGNRVVDSIIGSAGPVGGGISIVRSNGVRLIRNEIGENAILGTTLADGGDGAGIHIVAGEAIAVSNWIHDNDFSATTADLAAEGGGIAFFSGSLDLCGNLIAENRAKVGGGVWARLGTGFVGTGFPDILPRFYARENRLFSNSAWEPSTGGTNSVAYAGGGMSIRTTADLDQTYTLQVLSNQFEANTIWSSTTQPAGVPAEVGGGVHAMLILPKTSGLLEEFPGIESNLFMANIADRDGGGAWLYARLTPFVLQGEFLRFHNNTALRNELDASSGERGSGVFFAGEDSLGAGAENVFDASSNISFENEATLGVLQAFAECPDTGSAPWRYSQMEGPGGAGCPGTSGWDLTAGSSNSAASPQFRLGTSSVSNGRLAEDSPCVDTAEAALEGILFATTDFDGQPRIFNSPHGGAPGVDLDRGGDEVNTLDFRRGDANGDGNFDIADPVHTFAVLFNGAVPQNCEDSFDANDDEDLDISDPTLMLYELFTDPPPVTLPPPFGSCGVDPTPGELVCDFEAGGC